jgi:hypothetical protein
MMESGFHFESLLASLDETKRKFDVFVAEEHAALAQLRTVSDNEKAATERKCS